MRRPSQQLVRWIALISAVLFAGSQVAELIHNLTVSHDVCVEHGRIVELHHEQGNLDGPSGNVGISEASGAAEHGNPCTLFANRHDVQAPSLSVPDLDGPTQHAFVPAQPSDLRLAARRGLLLRAPKNSPPSPLV